MSKEKVFRIAIGVWLTSLIAANALILVLEQTLPPPLVQYLESQSDVELSGIGAIVGFGVLVILFVVLFASSKLYKLDVKGRTAFTVGNILIVCLTPLFGPVVSDAYSPVLGSVSVAATGFIIAMAFTTDILNSSS